MSEMSELRGFLMKSVRELADSDAGGEDLDNTVKRCKAQSDMARTYIQTVKAEVEAFNAAFDAGIITQNNAKNSGLQKLISPTDHE